MTHLDIRGIMTCLACIGSVILLPGLVLRVCQRKWQHFDVSVVSVEVDTFEFSLVDQTCLEHLRALHPLLETVDMRMRCVRLSSALPGLGVLVAWTCHWL
jgi:hypothetical protein